ncbi:MAG: metallophosphoesterase [Actinomycetota bacterium]
MTPDLATEIVADLLRSAWIVEEARAATYERWAKSEERWLESAARAHDRASIVAAALARHDRSPDAGFVEPHTAWIESLVGTGPHDAPLADFFLARLGDWVDGHAADFTADPDSLRKLGVDEKNGLSFPDQLPEAPGYEPLAPVELEPPGETRFRFGILADMHIGSPHAETAVRAAIGDLNRSGAELVVQLGDITDHGDLGEFETAQSILAELEMPYLTMMGNHDVMSFEEERLTGREYFERFFNRVPDGVLHEHKGIRFAVLDSVEHAMSPFPPFNLVTGAFESGQGGAIVRGAFSVPQHEILAEVAAPGAPPAFVFLHHPPQPFSSFPPILFGLRDVDSGRLHATVDSGNVWGVFAGHTHRNARPRAFDKVVVQEVAIPRDYPFGYALVDVTDNGFAYRFLQLSDESLLRDGYSRSGAIHRNYGRGPEDARGFEWTKG